MILIIIGAAILVVTIAYGKVTFKAESRIARLEEHRESLNRDKVRLTKGIRTLKMDCSEAKDQNNYLKDVISSNERDIKDLEKRLEDNDKQLKASQATSQALTEALNTIKNATDVVIGAKAVERVVRGHGDVIYKDKLTGKPLEQDQDGHWREKGIGAKKDPHAKPHWSVRKEHDRNH